MHLASLQILWLPIYLIDLGRFAKNIIFYIISLRSANENSLPRASVSDGESCHFRTSMNHNPMICGRYVPQGTRDPLRLFKSLISLYSWRWCNQSVTMKGRGVGDYDLRLLQKYFRDGFKNNY